MVQAQINVAQRNVAAKSGGRNDGLGLKCLKIFFMALIEQLYRFLVKKSSGAYLKSIFKGEPLYPGLGGKKTSQSLMLLNQRTCHAELLRHIRTTLLRMWIRHLFAVTVNLDSESSSE